MLSLFYHTDLFKPYLNYIFDYARVLKSQGASEIVAWWVHVVKHLEYEEMYIAGYWFYLKGRGASIFLVDIFRFFTYSFIT